MGSFSAATVKCKGSSGMTLLASSKYTGTFLLPDIGFDFPLSGKTYRDKIYVDADSCISIHSSVAQELRINKDDTNCSFDSVYYSADNQGKTFRVRYEGQNNDYIPSANNLVWEATFFYDGTIMVCIEKTPGGGDSLFWPPGNSIVSFIPAADKSFVFIPSSSGYTCSQGSYSLETLAISMGNVTFDYSGGHFVYKVESRYPITNCTIKVDGTAVGTVANYSGAYTVLPSQIKNKTEQISIAAIDDHSNSLEKSQNYIISDDIFNTYKIMKTISQGKIFRVDEGLKSGIYLRGKQYDPSYISQQAFDEGFTLGLLIGKL